MEFLPVPLAGSRECGRWGHFRLQLVNSKAGQHYCSARRFQLLGCACLRLAMTHAACDAKQLDAARFADMTNNSYTAAQVDAETQVIRCTGKQDAVFAQYRSLSASCSSSLSQPHAAPWFPLDAEF